MPAKHGKENPLRQLASYVMILVVVAAVLLVAVTVNTIYLFSKPAGQFISADPIAIDLGKCLSSYTGILTGWEQQGCDEFGEGVDEWLDNLKRPPEICHWDGAKCTGTCGTGTATCHFNTGRGDCCCSPDCKP